MKRAIMLLAMAMVACGASFAFAGGFNTTYTAQTTSVNSGSVPVNVLPAAQMQTFCITADAGCTKGLLVFPYTGTIPGAAPGGTYYIQPGATICDGITNDLNIGHDAIGEAWGAVFASGGATCNAYSVYR